MFQNVSTFSDHKHSFDPNSIEFVSQIDQLQYDYSASLVGTIILVLPDDPLLDSFERKTELTVERRNGPIPIVVITYIPPGFTSDEKNNEKIVRNEVIPSSTRPKENDDGLFYLVPIISFQQLRTVLNHCTMRLTNVSDKLWFKLHILNLAGVIALTPSELTSRTAASKNILASIEKAIFSLKHDISDKHDFVNGTYEQQGETIASSPNDNKRSHYVKANEDHSPPFESESICDLERFQSYDFCNFDSFDRNPISFLSTIGIERNSKFLKTNLVFAIKHLIAVNETLVSSPSFFKDLSIPERSTLNLVQFFKLKSVLNFEFEICGKSL